MNALHFFFGVGAVLAPIVIAGLVAFSGSITWAYWTLALLALPAALWLLPWPSPTAPAVAEVTATGAGFVTAVDALASSCPWCAWKKSSPCLMPFTTPRGVMVAPLNWPNWPPPPLTGRRSWPTKTAGCTK